MSFSEVVQKSFLAYKNRRFSELTMLLEETEFILEKICDSPMERLFFIDVLEECYAWNLDISIIKEFDEARYITCRLSNMGDSLENYRLSIRPQCPVTLDGTLILTPKDKFYTIDFLLELTKEIDLITHSVANIVVEIDGHDFHERTKEQAKRDKERDRYFTKAGYKVYRYTGSEVFQNNQRRLRFINIPDDPNTYIAEEMMVVLLDEIENDMKKMETSE
ncbi:MAG: DUF559 domain-containing protein [Desulfobulbaceae bacterium]|nr:DUF559 domain-containing protein [Desulfobulbaceae bacterium]